MAKEKRNNVSVNTVKKHATASLPRPPTSALVENMDGVYAAVPLETSTHANIRLLRLCDPPRHRSQHYGLACKVEAYLQTPVYLYTSISYMWGSAIEARDELVNDNRFQVTLEM